VSGHVHTCRACAPDLFLDGPRIGEHHIAVRFNDHRRRPSLRIFLNGVVVDSCTEALAGEHGRVWFFSSVDGRHYHQCPCGAHRVCESSDEGMVEIRSADALELSTERAWLDGPEPRSPRFT
jgi:hypothetical protein